MYFKKLEMFGFKSFAERTVLRFEPGITAVVGPNGCGKSNIFDAIRWVLGEQSIKSLRGAKMEDIIFNGTEKIPALGFAEVSLSLSNEAKILPIDYEEVTVTRRLFRSGESEYLINNNPVRLKDINEILMGTGIGAESYSLVQQGKIDLVLSSRPEDRRLVFDEATGVSKYKAKKKEAIRKLEETENNLLRVNDIIQEVKRQINSIERQASKARRYKEVFETLKAMEIDLAIHDHHQLQLHSKKLNEAATALRETIIQDAKKIEELACNIEGAQQELETLHQEKLQLNNSLLTNQNQVDQKRQHVTINEERIAELQSRAKILEDQRDAVQNRIDQGENELSKFSHMVEKVQLDAQQKQTMLTEKEKDLKEIENFIREGQERIKSTNSKNFEIAANQTKFNNELIDISSSMTSLNARKRRLETELIKTRQERESLDGEFKSIQSDVEALRKEFHDKKEQLAISKNVLAKAYLEIEERKESINKLNEEKIGLESQKEFLQQLTLKYESMKAARDAELILKNIDRIEEKEISGIVAKATAVSYDPHTRTYRIACEAKLFSLDIKLTEEKIIQIGIRIKEETELLNQKKQQAQSLQQELSVLESAVQEKHVILTDKEAILKHTQANYQKVCDELSLVSLDLEDIATNIANLTKRESTLRAELSILDQENKNQQHILAVAQAEIQSNSLSRETFLVEIAELKTELSSIQAKVNDITSTRDMIAQTLSETKTLLDNQKQEKENCLARISELAQESSHLNSEIELFIAQTATLQSKILEQNQRVAHGEQKLHELRKEEQALMTVNNGLKENLHHQEMQLQENDFKINQLKDRMAQLYQYTIAPQPEGAQHKEIDVEATKREVESLRNRVDGFGTVNLVAIEELEELKNRYTFLEQQQADLLKAKDSLNEAIQKINRTTRKMFLDTFTKVVVEFKNYFRLLFGGGDAELFLIDEENVLESGIEIVCRPPGKKLQNILLLSGGEKTLAAIALIFAIFKTKPAPFCVLDEIDAALDESNVIRFSRMLKEFTQYSQFIVITHNKKTIAHADVMYGITMEHSGLSKIVSVKFTEKAEKEEGPQQQAPSIEPDAVQA